MDGKRQAYRRHLIFFGGLLSLLAAASLARGGHPAWAALTLAGGLVGLLVLWLCRALWTASGPILWSRQDLVLLVGLLWVVSRSVRPSAPPEALDAVLIILGCLACFCLARLLAFDGLALPLAMGVCAIGGGTALVGLLQTLDVLGHGWWNPPQFVAATFVNHNHFAAYLELLLPVGLALWLAAPLKAPQRFLVAVCSALMLIGFIMSCSRGAWLSLTLCAAVGLGWFGLLRRRRIWSWRRSLGMAVAAAAIWFLASQPPIVARGLSVLDAPNVASFQARQAIWRSAWELAKAQPLVGQGVGSFQFAVLPYRPAGLYGRIPYAFNEYLQLVAELGLVGLLLAVWIAFGVGVRMVRLIRLSHTPWKRTLGLGGLIGIVSVALHSFGDYPWHLPAIAAMGAAIAGLLSGISYQADPSPLRHVRDPGVLARGVVLRQIAAVVLGAALVVASVPLARLVVADVWAARGQAHQKTGTVDDAIGSYQHAIRRAPRRVDYHRRLGDSLIQRAWQRRGYERRAAFTQATEAYRKALGLVPSDAWSAHALGEALKAMGDVEDADRWLKQAVTLDPQNPLYWKHWADLSLIRGDAPKAAEAFRRAAESARPDKFFPSLFGVLDDPRHFLEAGESALLLGRLTLAQTAFTIALQFDPTHPGARVGLALCALSRGDAETAHQLMAAIHDPVLRAKWVAGLASHHLKQGQEAQAHVAIDTSLKLDPSNLLARHLQLLIARRRQDDPRDGEAVDQLLSLNHPPVFVRKGSADEPLVVWEPEKGTYEQGRKTRGGWALVRHGMIQQPLAVPPGRVRFRVTASGTQAHGVGPTLAVSWNGRPILTTELRSEEWAVYEVETEVRPGESLLRVDFPNDLEDLVAHEDRNLQLEQVAASWEPL